MLKMIALAAALTLAATVAPIPGSEAQAARETYMQCVHNAFAGCTPQGPMGPYLPEAGTPEYDAYQTCLANWLDYCATLPDAP